MARPDRHDTAYQMELYVLLNDALDRLPLDTILDELTQIAIHLQHNTVDYCYGCESCPLRELCSRAVPSTIPVAQPTLTADS
jgi:hypothetical protein